MDSYNRLFASDEVVGATQLAALADHATSYQNYELSSQPIAMSNTIQELHSDYTTALKRASDQSAASANMGRHYTPNADIARQLDISLGQAYRRLDVIATTLPGMNIHTTTKEHNILTLAFDLHASLDRVDELIADNNIQRLEDIPAQTPIIYR